MAESVPGKDLKQHVRLPVDRSFAMKGFGTVVTGTLISGTLKVEDEVEIRTVRGWWVVDSAVDCVSYDALRMEAATNGVGFHTNSNQIITLKAVQRVFLADSHSLILRGLQKEILFVVKGGFLQGFCDFHRVFGW